MLRAAFVVLLCGQFAVALADNPRRQVAVTIDDLPTVNTMDNSPEIRLASTARLLSILSSRNIPAIGFVNENQFRHDDTINVDIAGLLQYWLDQGFALGNHTYSHPDLHRVSLSDFKKNVVDGETYIRPLLERNGQHLEYFRHPYLHTGTDLDTKIDLEKFLTHRNYKIAPVSIDNSDWIFARAYVVALRSNDEEIAQRVGQDYVSYMLNVFRFYEDQSRQLFSRNIAHILLIHANELNADWFGKLADALDGIGYRFVSLDLALEDPAYESPDTYTGTGGITWLHRWAITREVDPAMFRGEPVPPDYVLELAQ